MLQGLFVGIDRYPPPVTRLSCARADALALSTLFEDTLGGSVTCLLDAESTRSSIIEGLRKLRDVEENDLVVISFSGHGTEDHALVPADVDPDDLAGSCLPPSDLAVELDAIPSRRLLVVLDCCFSGGFGGARVFATHSERSPLEDRGPLEGLVRGSGRVVITASGAGEPALETSEFGHGLFTYYLLKAMQGEGGRGSDGRIGLLELVQHVTMNVVAAAERLREIQTPTLYGSVEGAPQLNVLTPGAAYAKAFPDRVLARATEAWNSLAAFGFPQQILDRWSQAMPGPNAMQIEAINNFGVLRGESVLVVAPTAAGKTMVGELAAMRRVVDGSRAVMLLPLKALVNDKYEYMTQVYGDEAQIIRATGDHGDQVGALLSGQYDIALLTYEKFLSLVLGSPHIMRGLSVVIVDEVQMLGDTHRGSSLEFLLTLLRAGHGRIDRPQTVALSAVIGDTRGLERWLGGCLLRWTERPVPLRESVLEPSGLVRSKEPDGSESSTPSFVSPLFGPGSQSSKPWVIPLVARLVSEDKKVIVFRATRGDTVGAALYLADSLGLIPAEDVIDQLPAEDTSAASENLRRSLIGGVAFHNSDLDREERSVLEQSFRDPDSDLRVMVATTTLAMGVNTPAEAVVVVGLTHPPRPGTPYSVAEYKNMVGRAGRLGHSEEGESFIVATADPGPGVAWDRYVNGEPEGVRSHFLAATTDPQTLVVRSLAALGGTVAEPDLVELLENSFALWLANEAGQPGWDTGELQSTIDQLVQGGLVDHEPSEALTLTALGRYAGESGIEVQSITNIGSALRMAPPTLTGPDIVALAQVTAELQPLYIPANRRSRQERMRWPSTLQQMGVNRGIVQSLHVGGTDPFDAMKRAVACLLMMTSHPLAEVESHLLQHTRDRSAAGNIRQVTSRTRDVIDAVTQVATLQGRSVIEGLTTDDLGLQLEIGLPNEAIPLARVLGADLGRGTYLALLSSGIGSMDQLGELETDGLKATVGETATRTILQRLAG